MLKAIAGVQGDLMLVRGDFEVPLKPFQTITLREAEVLFFRSVQAAKVQTWQHRLAA